MISCYYLTSIERENANLLKSLTCQEKTRECCDETRKVIIQEMRNEEWLSASAHYQCISAVIPHICSDTATTQSAES